MTRVDYRRFDKRRIKTNSKDVKRGDIFIAVKGSHFNGHDFVHDAIEKKAACCIVSNRTRMVKKDIIDRTRMIYVPDTREELSKIASILYADPSSKLKVIGVTGTNGKTTVSYLIDKFLRDKGKRTGVVGTVSYRIGDKSYEADRTTPDALYLNDLLDRMVSKDIEVCIMEVSSHALEQKRTKHIFFDMAVFTNLTPEHLDYHKDMDSYFNAKARIFDNLKQRGVAVINGDDDRYKALMRRLSKRRVVSFGINKGKKRDYVARNINLGLSGSQFSIENRGIKEHIETRLIGRHNVSNIMAAVSTAHMMGVKIKEAAMSVKDFNGAPGRLESIDEGQDFKVFVDYAHTPDALRKAIKAIKPFVKRKLITVFGCGGERDRTKRPVMGRTSGCYSDYTVITSDNPRGESQERIASEIEKGISTYKGRYSIILDRNKAIMKAIGMAKKGDVVLIAGKGHETTQVIGTDNIHFSDREVARSLLRQRQTFIRDRK